MAWSSYESSTRKLIVTALIILATIALVEIALLIPGSSQYLQTKVGQHVSYYRHLIATVKETITVEHARLSGSLGKDVGIVTAYQASGKCGEEPSRGLLSLAVNKQEKQFMLPCTHATTVPVQIGELATIAYQARKCPDSRCLALNVKPTYVLGETTEDVSGGGYNTPTTVTEDFIPPENQATPLQRVVTAIIEPVKKSLPTTTVTLTAAATVSAVATVTTLTTSAVTSAVTSAAASTGNTSFLQALLPFLALRRRRLPLGRVVENDTNQPIHDVVVTFFDQANRPRATVRTREDGTFATLLPRGIYRITASKNGRVIEQHPEHIALFPNERLYTGGTLEIEDDETLVPVVIALNRDSNNPVRVATFKNVFKRLKIIQAKWAVYILLVGAAIHTYALLQNPTLLFVIIAILYIVFLVMELLLSRVVRRAVGQVRDATTHSPVSLALVRLSDPLTSKIIETKATLPQGHFLLLPPPGEYTLQIIHQNYSPYTAKALNIGKSNAPTTKITANLNPKNKPRPDSNTDSPQSSPAKG